MPGSDAIDRPAILSTISRCSARCTVPGVLSHEEPRAERRPSWRCVRPTGYERRRIARAHANTTPESHRRSEIDPRLCGRGQLRSCNESEIWRVQRFGSVEARSGWFWPAIPGAARHSRSSAPLFHVNGGQRQGGGFVGWWEAFVRSYSSCWSCHCERSEAIHASGITEGCDCVVAFALAMTGPWVSPPRFT